MDDRAAYTIHPEIEVRLTSQDIDDIMCTALDYIGYWCGGTKVIGKRKGEYAHEQISRGGSLILFDAESSDKWELTLTKFLAGVKKYFEESCHIRVEDGALDASDIDGEDADCIVQYALFGEVQFG